MRGIALALATGLGLRGFRRAGADAEGDEIARCAALRCPSHHLGACRRHHQHDPRHAGRAGLGRQDRHPLPREILDHQRGRQALHLQAARRRHVLQRQEVHVRRCHLQLQAPARPRHQGAAEMARRQRERAARAGSHHRGVRAERALLGPDAEPRELQHGDPQSGEHREARQGLRHPGDRRHRTMVLRNLEAAHRDGAASGTTPTGGGRRCTRTRAPSNSRRW